MTQPTSTSSSALYYGMGSKPGFAGGYWFLPYSNGTNIVYVSNDDPECAPANFGSPTTIKAGSDGSYFQALLQGEYCYLASVTPDSNPIKIRRGNCSGGAISWDAEATGATGTQMRITSMDIDPDGAILIGYYADNKARVTKLTYDGSSWSVAFGYPMTVSDSGEDSVNMYVKVLALTSGKWMCLYCGVTGGHIYEKIWNGSALGSRVQASSIICSATPRWDARAYGDKVVLAWNAQDILFNIYRREFDGSSWGTAVEIEHNCDYDDVPAVSVNKDSGDFFIAWQDFPTTSHVYYQKYTALTDTWGSVVDAATESSLPNNYQMMGINQAVNDSVLFFYQIGSTPYAIDNIRIESLTASAGGAGPSGGCMIFGGVGIL
ncbi:MAG: hypothetical protein GXX95_01185 [Methanomassiliicoccus sp.]|nr:hypothetical protein [Methanomassiliicoccus sp.]